MSKRFTETLKWDDSWFIELTPNEKLLWFYILDKCDIAGVLDFSERHADFSLNIKGSSKHLIALESKLTPLGGNKFFINGFIDFQYGTLKESCKPHLAVIKLLDKHGISLDDVEQSGRIGSSHSISSKVRKFVISRDGKQCTYCEKEVNNFDLCLDHIVPRVNGGGDEEDNLVVSCRSCNSSKGDKDLVDFIQDNTLSDTVLQRVSERVSYTLKDKDKEKEEEKNKGYTFEEFWDSYGKKGNRKTAEERFNKLSSKTKQIIKEYLPSYIESTPEFKFRKDASTWLNQECWNDEIIQPQLLTYDQQIQQQGIEIDEDYR